MGFIMGLFKFIGWAVATVVILIVLALIGARFTDGPTEILAGGPFTSGSLVTEEPDWTFLTDRDTVEVQLMEPARSRTTWLAVVDGRVFIPSAYMDSTWGRIWKQWPIHAEKNGDAILRVDDQLYHRTMVRVKNEPALATVFSELGRKYAPGGGETAERYLNQVAVDEGATWIFELVPRTQT